MRLKQVQPALTSAADQKLSAILKAEVGAATYKEAERLQADAETHIDMISNPVFWEALTHVIADLEPICLGTNIGQKDSTRADQVLLTIAGIWIHFEGHSEGEVATGMTKGLEKRWKDSDQPFFLL